MIKLILPLFVFFSISSLSQTTGAPDTLKNTGNGITGHGDAFLSESFIVGNIKYPNADLNILIRKSKNLLTNATDKDLSIEGRIGEDGYQGFIDISEIDGALESFRYVADSLLPKKPTDKVFYIKTFLKSNFQIQAEIDPYSSFVTTKGWEVFMGLDKNVAGSSVKIKATDIDALIQLLKTAKEKLKGF
jgi:hypothetical protein